MRLRARSSARVRFPPGGAGISNPFRRLSRNRRKFGAFSFAGNEFSPNFELRRSILAPRPSRRRSPTLPGEACDGVGRQGRPVPSRRLREPDSVVTVRRPRLIPLACLLVIMASPPARAGVKGVLLVPEVIPSPAHPLSVLTPSPRRCPVQLDDGEA